MSLLLGLLAALAWGIHDVCVRYVSQRIAVLSAMVTVMATGTVLVAPVALLAADWSDMSGGALALAAGAGAAFALANFGLFQAFSIGPVGLVAPVIAAYPVLSLAWAVRQGAEATPLHWLSLALIIAGVAVVSAQRRAGAPTARLRAVLWSLLAGTAFAVTFELSQAAARLSGELPTLLILRLAALACILATASAARTPLLAGRAALPILAAMGALDALALGAVTTAAGFARPEFAVVASSVFGVITIVLAWIFLRESLSPRQWGGVLLAFGGIGFLAWLG